MAGQKTVEVGGFTLEANTEPLPTRRTPFSAELADRLFAIASGNANGASNGQVYAGEEDETYKEHTSLFRRALQSRLDKNVQRARIVAIPQGEDGVDGVKFAVVIAAYNPRGPRNAADEDEDEAEAEADAEA
jgi:hypothetical protein